MNARGLEPCPTAPRRPTYRPEYREAEPASTDREAEQAGTDYTAWSFEELRALARQLRLPGAETKSRRELLDLFMCS